MPEAGRHRGFYRPHEGFAEWEPKDNQQEILDEAFVYAATNGRLDAMQYLLDRGADMNGMPYKATALQSIAHGGRHEVMMWLLENGADVHVPWNVPTGSTPLHMAALQGRLASVKALVQHAAHPQRKDKGFGSTPAGYAHWSGAQDVIEYLERIT